MLSKIKAKFNYNLSASFQKWQVEDNKYAIRTTENLHTQAFFKLRTDVIELF